MGRPALPAAVCAAVLAAPRGAAQPSAGGAVSLVASSTPAGAAGRPLWPQPAFQLVDAAGRPAPSPAAFVTLYLAQGPAPLGGSLTAAADALDPSSFRFTTVRATQPGAHEVLARASLPDGRELARTFLVDVVAPVPVRLALVTDGRIVGAPAAPLLPQPMLRLVDASGRPTPDPGGGARCALTAGAAGIKLQGGAAEVAAGGSDGATCEFNGVEVSPQGRHKLRVTAVLSSGRSLLAEFEAEVTASVPLPTQAVLTSSPLAQAQQPFAVPITLALVDSAQRRVPNAATAVLTPVAAPGGGSLTGPLMVSVDESMTQLVFGRLSASAPGRYTAHAAVALSGGQVLSKVVVAFDVADAPPRPDCLCVLQPPRGRAGAPLAQQPAFALGRGCAAQRCGELVSVANSSVSLFVAAAPAGGQLRGGAELAADGEGRFRFADVALSAPGTYTLVARARLANGTLLPDLRIEISAAAGALPFRVVSATAPTAPRAGAALSPPLEVALLGADGRAAPDAWAQLGIAPRRDPAGRMPLLQGRTAPSPTASPNRYRFDPLALSPPGVWDLEVSAALSGGDVLWATVTVVVGGDPPPPRLLVPVPPDAALPTAPPHAGGTFVPLSAVPRFRAADSAGEPASAEGALCTARLAQLPGASSAGAAAAASAAGTVTARMAAGMCSFPELGAAGHGVFRLEAEAQLGGNGTVLRAPATVVLTVPPPRSADRDWWHFAAVGVIALALAAAFFAAALARVNLPPPAAPPAPAALSQPLLAAAGGGAEQELKRARRSAGTQTDLHWEEDWPDPRPPGADAAESTPRSAHSSGTSQTGAGRRSLPRPGTGTSRPVSETPPRPCSVDSRPQAAPPEQREAPAPGLPPPCPDPPALATRIRSWSFDGAPPPQLPHEAGQWQQQHSPDPPAAAPWAPDSQHGNSASQGPPFASPSPQRGRPPSSSFDASDARLTELDMVERLAAAVNSQRSSLQLHGRWTYAPSSAPAHPAGCGANLFSAPAGRGASATPPARRTVSLAPSPLPSAWSASPQQPSLADETWPQLAALQPAPAGPVPAGPAPWDARRRQALHAFAAERAAAHSRTSAGGGPAPPQARPHLGPGRADPAAPAAAEPTPPAAAAPGGEAQPPAAALEHPRTLSPAPTDGAASSRTSAQPPPPPAGSLALPGAAPRRPASPRGGPGRHDLALPGPAAGAGPDIVVSPPGQLLDSPRSPPSEAAATARSQARRTLSAGSCGLSSATDPPPADAAVSSSSAAAVPPPAGPGPSAPPRPDRPAAQRTRRRSRQQSDRPRSSSAEVRVGSVRFEEYSEYFPRPGAEPQQPLLQSQNHGRQTQRRRLPDPTWDLGGWSN